jgi:phage FluMu gp28-like protein
MVALINQNAIQSGILLPYQRRWVQDKSRFKIGMMSRQSGKSFATSLEAVDDSIERKTTWIYLSRGERQSRELANTVTTHLAAYRQAAESLEDYFLAEDGSRHTQLEKVLPNGSRHIFLPANPDTARGYSGNVLLDEFGFHRDSRAIWQALYPIITRRPDYKLRVISTPNGLNNKFADLWHGRGGGPSIWSKHRVDIYDAVREGLPVNAEELKAGLQDDEAWAQEYELQFLDEATAFLSYELIGLAENERATMLYDLAQLIKGSSRYLGVDIGRRRDLTVLWLLERLGDVYWTRVVERLQGAAFRVQAERIDAYAPHITRGCLDSTGLGMQLAEQAIERHGSKFEAVTFTGAVKNDLATTFRRAFEDRTIRIPVEDRLRTALHKVRKITTSAGNPRYDADSEADGHADEFWGGALAMHAAAAKDVGGLITL